MLKKIRNNLEKGSISVYAIATVFCFLFILSGIFASSVSIRKNQLKTLLKIKEIYAQDLENIQAVYEEQENLRKPQMPESWDDTKVTAVLSEDNIVVPVPIGFKASTITGEKSVATGFVIKQGDDGSATTGINEFVWVPVSNPSSMFTTTTDSDGNTINIGQLYGFSGTSSYKMKYSTTDCHEPDVVTGSDGTSYDVNSTYLATLELGSSSEFKTQLQNEFEAMKTSVETYGGFYIGRYETGNLSEEKAVVQKNNEDIANQNWYVQYMKSKTIAQGTEATSSMIWGCQWDATLNWFLSSSEEKVKNFPTNSALYGNYIDNEISYEEGGETKSTTSGTETKIPTGSAEITNINNIYDMAGNIGDWTIETYDTAGRIRRRMVLRRPVQLIQLLAATVIYRARAIPTMVHVQL